MALQPLEEVQQDDADGGEREHRARVHRPRLLCLGIDAQQPVSAALDPGILVRSEDLGHIATQWPIGSGQERDEKADLEQAGSGVGHQNLSGKISAATR